MHYMRWSRWGDPAVNHRPARTESERFWERVKRAGAADCWEWAGPKSRGYGVFNGSQVAGERTTMQAHRFAYRELVRPLTADEQLDHLCRNRACVNPAHLEPVTNMENQHRARVARDACRNGHPWQDSTTYTSASGKRTCKVCRRAADRRRVRQ